MPKERPTGQAQVDSGGIEGIDYRIQIERQWFAGVQRPGKANEVLRQIGVDLPRACRIRVGQRVARNRGTPKAHVIQAPGLGAQVDLDVAQRFSISQLSERHRKELIQAVEVLDFEISPVVRHTAAKSAHGQMRHELSEYELALMHGGEVRENAQNRESDIRRSNRDQIKMLKSASKSLTYDGLM